MSAGMGLNNIDVRNDNETTFDRDPAGYIAQQVRMFKLEEAAKAAAAAEAAEKAPTEGYQAGEVDGTRVRDFAASKSDEASDT